MGRVEDLEGLLKRATPGPWRWWTSNSYRRLSSDATGKDGDVLHGDTHRDGITDVVGREEDRDLIVAAVNALPDLVKLAKAAEDCLRYRPGTRRHKDAEETMRIALARLDGDGK